MNNSWAMALIVLGWVGAISITNFGLVRLWHWYASCDERRYQ